LLDSSSRAGWLIITAFTGSLLAVAPGRAQDINDGCLNLAKVVADWSAYEPATPATRRAKGLRIIEWNESPILFLNDGNGLVIYDIADPLSPKTLSSVRLACGGEGCPAIIPGDHDWVLYNFSVCDDCRFGVAQMWIGGTVIFDLGTGSQPDFKYIELHEASTRTEGAFVFSHLGQQYFIMTDHPGGCGTGDPWPKATLFKLNGIGKMSGDIVKLSCIETVDGLSFYVNNGLYLSNDSGTFLYLIEKSNARVHIYKVSGSGDGLQLSYMGQPLFGYSRYGSSIRADLDSNLLMVALPASPATRLYDIKDLANPTLITDFDILTGGEPVSIAAIRYPDVWVGIQATETSFSIDIYSEASYKLVDQGFWDAEQDWNSYPYLGNADAAFHPDARVLYLARHSVFQVVSLSNCSYGLFSDGFETRDTSKWTFTVDQ
jgi:hypothetical protein